VRVAKKSAAEAQRLVTSVSFDVICYIFHVLLAEIYSQ